MTSTVPDKHCPTCGHDGSQAGEDSRGRIQELEGQVQDLNTRAQDTGKADDARLFHPAYPLPTARKLAESEDEVRRLRQNADPSLTAAHTTPSAQPDAEKALPPDAQSQQQQSRLATFTSLLPSRRPSDTPSTQPHSNPRPETGSQDIVDLRDTISREQNLRKAAESQLSQAHSELEELTTQLFGQANEMVAQERKARAKLEERVTMLERRDVDKRARLERLEKAMERVERLRKLVG